MSYRVIIPPAAEPITLEEAKAHLRVVVIDDDAQIEGMIRAAREMLEMRLNRALMPQTIEVAAEAFSLLQLPRVPFRSLISLTYTDPYGADQVVDSTGYFLDTYREPPAISAYPGTVWPALRYQPAAVRLRYEAGYDSAEDVPAPLKQWMLLAITTMYENRASVVAGVSVTQLPDEFMHGLWHPYMVYV